MKFDLSLQNTAPCFDRLRQEPALRISKSESRILLFFCLYMLAALAANMLVQFAISVGLAAFAVQLSHDAGMTLTLMLTSVEIIVTLIYCRCIERRSFRTMGLTAKRMLPDYLTGLIIGFVMFSAVLLLICAGGAARQDTAAEKPQPVAAVLLFAAWMIQGFSEELTFRGFLMMSYGARVKPWRAVMYSAVAFACAHLGNNGISPFALVNLTLFGVLMSLIFLRTDSIWCAAALHTVWNWAQGSFYGLQVSGMDSGSSFFRFALTGDRAWLGGGAFGPEGGAATTLLLAFFIAVFLILPNRQTKTKS